MCRNIRCDFFFCVYGVYGVGTKQGLRHYFLISAEYFNLCCPFGSQLHKLHLAWTAVILRRDELMRWQINLIISVFEQWLHEFGAAMALPCNMKAREA